MGMRGGGCRGAIAPGGEFSRLVHAGGSTSGWRSWFVALDSDGKLTLKGAALSALDAGLGREISRLGGLGPLRCCVLGCWSQWNIMIL